MKLRFTMTKEDIERSRDKLLEERPELAKLLKPKRITGSTRNAALREMLRTTAKVSKATMPKPITPGAK
jgi:hypothetical protein